jgi:Protein of unknown function (DUF3046)
MRLSMFKELVRDEFGEAYGAVICRDLVLSELNDQTADAALKAGEDPRNVWLALCRAQSVPESRWHGLNKNTKK